MTPFLLSFLLSRVILSAATGLIQSVVDQLNGCDDFSFWKAAGNALTSGIAGAIGTTKSPSGAFSPEQWKKVSPKNFPYFANKESKIVGQKQFERQLLDVIFEASGQSGERIVQELVPALK